MSRLDYITIAIVAACIIAIIFLIYKMTDLFNEEPVNDKIENPIDKVETEDDVYDYKIDDEKTAGDTSQATSATDNEKAPSTATDTGNGTTGQTSASADDADEEDDRVASKPVRSGSSGKFMVISGTYSKRDLARKQVAKLKSLGYDNASMEIFDRGKYAVVLADRFNNMASAERLVKDLKAEGINSYVKIKEGM